jgi:nucleotide-binding universal stress UspA family protein
MLLHVLGAALVGEQGAEKEACADAPLSRGKGFRWVARTHTWLQSLEGDPGLGSKVRSIVAVGTPGPMILERARTSRADLIVVGRNGTHALSSTDMGSATGLILRGAQVPVLVVP